MAPWTAFPYAGDYAFDTTSVQKNWGKLHIGDAEPLPQDPKLIDAWVMFHNGEFQQAAQAGLKAGAQGISLANKAACMYASYLEPKEKTRLDLFLEVAQRAEAQTKTDPQNTNAHYWHAFALGHYSQGISVAKALALGLGGKIKLSLETAIQLSPQHVAARIALGAFHAEVIDKVGSLIGHMTFGAKKEVGLQLFQEALKLAPNSAIALVEYANAMMLLDGDERMSEATRLYERAAASEPHDATERLVVNMAIAELAG